MARVCARYANPLSLTLPRFGNCRNVEMNISGQFAGGPRERLCRFQQIQRLTFVLQPIRNAKAFGEVLAEVKSQAGGDILSSNRSSASRGSTFNVQG